MAVNPATMTQIKRGNWLHHMIQINEFKPIKFIRQIVLYNETQTTLDTVTQTNCH